MISTNNAKQKPTRMNIRLVLRPALVALSAAVRGPAKFTIPSNNEPMAQRKVPTITNANQWLNMPVTLGGAGGFVNP